jgi:putative transposase
MGKRRYRRHLPHQIPENTPIFLTWNLKGAFPQDIADELEALDQQALREPKRENETSASRRERLAKQRFARRDAYLDSRKNGPLSLKDPAAAKIVEDSILFGVPERYELYAWCVMGNHVHLLLTPRWELKDISQGIKGYTARQINSLQNAAGRPFWQDESYDHWSRDDDELMRIIAYIENNPVKAGLCQRAEDWPWSSARFRGTWKFGQPWQAAHFETKLDQ